MLTNWLGAIVKARIAVLLVLFALSGSALAQHVSLAPLQPDLIEPVPLIRSVEVALPDAPGDRFGISVVMEPRSFEPNPIVRSGEPLTLPEAPGHRFWDRENSVLFAANAALSTADFVVTRNNLRNGGQELNPVTRVFAGSTAGLVVNFAGETVAVVGISYFFHKTGHHKLERAVSLLNMGSSASAVAFDLAH